MEHVVYLVLAVTGGTLLLLQVILQAIGLHGGEGDFEHDGHADHDIEGHGNWFVGVLSLKALAAFAGILGLTGLALEGSDLSAPLRVSFAVTAGILAMLLVASLMRGLSRLASSGTLDLRNAVGRHASVYLRIPGGRRGEGKVTLEVQGRSMQLDAVTDEAEIPTGTSVQVVGLLGGETVQVRRTLV
jgi:hypothetical protein